MKKVLFVGLFICFFIGVQFLNPEKIDKHKAKKEELKRIELASSPLLTNTGIDVKEQTWGGEHYVLWKNEASSKTLNPGETTSILKYDNSHNTLKHHQLGYKLIYPSAWSIDTHQSPKYIRFYNKDFRLDITVQDTSKAWTNPYGYINNTISNLKSNIHYDKMRSLGAFTIRNVDYTRPVIEEIENDLNHYSYFFVWNDKYVYTFQLKTNEEQFSDYKEKINQMISSLETIESVETDLNQLAKKANQNPDVNLIHNKKSLVIPKSQFLMGIYTPKPRDINNFEQYFGNQIGSQMFYKPISSTFDAYTKELVEDNKLPMVTFLFQKENKENKHIVQEIIKGEFDSNLLSWAKQVKALEAPVLFRLGNEMNGNWSEWSHENNYNDPDLYKLSFKHIVELFRKEQVDNAYFVWNPNNVSAPYYGWNDHSMYYPGDKWVDFIGLTSYNFGKTKWNDFRSFSTIYEELYWEYSRSFSSKPLMIGEFASVETGGDKAKWISDMFNDIPNKYPNIKMAIWFDEIHHPYDLRIMTSQESGDAFKNGMNNQNVVKSLQLKNKTP